MASVAAGWLQFEAEAEAKLDRTLIASLVQSLQNDRGSLRDLCGLMSGVLFGAPPDVVVPT